MLWKQKSPKSQNWLKLHFFFFFLQILALICRENSKQPTSTLQSILIDLFILLFSLNLCIDWHTKKCRYCVSPLWGSTQQKANRIFPLVCGLKLKISAVANIYLWFFHIKLIKIIISNKHNFYEFWSLNKISRSTKLKVTEFTCSVWYKYIVET